MLREERLWRITEQLKRDRQVLSNALAEQLHLTPASVRADLAELERRGIARRVYGGAVLSSPNAASHEAISLDEAQIEARLDLLRAEKEAIGEAAITLIEDGETIMIDGGSTTVEVCRHLPEMLHLTIISNAIYGSLWEALAARPNLEIFLAGGYLRRQSMSLVGEVSETALRGFRATKAILGIDGISLEHGFTALNFLEASIKRRMIEGSQELIIVADHTKFSRVALIPVAPVDQVCTVVTDSGAPPEIVAGLRQRGVQVILAESAAAPSGDGVARMNGHPRG